MGVNRLNAVQKATYFLKKSKVGKNDECTVTVKTATDLKLNIKDSLKKLAATFCLQGKSVHKNVCIDVCQSCGSEKCFQEPFLSVQISQKID